MCVAVGVPRSNCMCVVSAFVVCLQVLSTHQSEECSLASTTGAKQDERGHDNGGALAVQDQVEDDGQRQGQQQGEEHGSDGRAEAPREPFSCGIHVDRHLGVCMNGRGGVEEEAIQSIDRSKVALTVPDHADAFPRLRAEHVCRKSGASPTEPYLQLDFILQLTVTNRAIEEYALVALRARSHSYQHSTCRGTVVIIPSQRVVIRPHHLNC